MKRHWSADYLGMSWKEHGLDRSGASCWGLARLVHHERRGEALPSYVGHVGADEAREIRHALGQPDGDWRWREVAFGEEAELDLVLFKTGGVEGHCGIVTWPGAMLHVTKGVESRIERYDREHWGALRSRIVRRELSDHLILPTRGAVTALPAFDPVVRRIELIMAPGVTIEDAIAIVLPGLGPDQRALLRVTIGDSFVPMAMWGKVKPKLWDTVLIRVIPGANNTLQIALTIALTVAAIAISAGTLGPEGAALGAAIGNSGLFAAGSFSAAALSATVVIGGSLLINTFLGPKKPDPSLTAGSVYAINGLQNQPNADGPVPSVLGEMRVAPNFAALPYSYVAGPYRYTIVAFLFGYGEYEISEPRLGRTELTIDNFQDFSLETFNGVPADGESAIYTQQVLEDDVSAEVLPTTDPPVTRFTATDVTSADVEFFYRAGLYGIDRNGSNTLLQVDFTVSYREVTGGTPPAWTDVPFSTFNLTATPFWSTCHIEFPVRAQYEIKVVRTSGYFDQFSFANQTKTFSHSAWSVLRSFRPEYPLAYEFPVGLAFLKIRATGQTNGTLDNFNCLVKRVCLDWDWDPVALTGTQTWIKRTTRNPASAARYVLQGPHNAFPESDDSLDLPTFEAWHDFCVLKGLNCDGVIDQPILRDEVLDNVAAAGRAIVHFVDGKWSVIIDETRTTFWGHISPRNSFGFKGNKPNPIFPDGIRFKFFDETNDYVASERIVPWPGHVGDVVTTEEWPLAYKTAPDEIWIEGRRRQYDAIYRDETVTLGQDFEHFAFDRGQGTLLNHDVLDRRQFSGRVSAIHGLVVTVDNKVSMEDGGSYQLRFRLSNGASLLRDVVTVVGMTNTLTLTAAPTGVQIGDLSLFGVEGAATSEWIVKTIERGDHLSAQISLVKNAHEIDTLTDAEIPPAWNGRAGGSVLTPSTAPAVPVFTSIVSSELAGNLPGDPVTIVVMLAPGPGSLPVESYDLRYRLQGSGTWIDDLAILGADTISGFAIGDTVEFQARATGFSAMQSAYSSTHTHEVGAADLNIPEIGSIYASRAALAAASPTGEGVLILLADGTTAAYRYNASSTSPSAVTTANSRVYENIEPVLKLEHMDSFVSYTQEMNTVMNEFIAEWNWRGGGPAVMPRSKPLLLWQGPLAAGAHYLTVIYGLEDFEFDLNGSYFYTPMAVSDFVLAGPTYVLLVPFVFQACKRGKVSMELIQTNYGVANFAAGFFGPILEGSDDIELHHKQTGGVYGVQANVDRSTGYKGKNHRVYFDESYVFYPQVVHEAGDGSHWYGKTYGCGRDIFLENAINNVVEVDSEQGGLGYQAVLTNYCYPGDLARSASRGNRIKYRTKTIAGTVAANSIFAVIFQQTGARAPGLIEDNVIEINSDTSAGIGNTSSPLIVISKQSPNGSSYPDSYLPGAGHVLRDLTIRARGKGFNTVDQNAVIAFGTHGLVTNRTAVRVRSIGNVSLTSGLVVGGLVNTTVMNGVTLATGDAVLLTEQTAPAENGVYLVPASGSASRRTDLDSSAELIGAIIPVTAGTLDPGSVWFCTNTSLITMGTTPIAFSVEEDWSNETIDNVRFEEISVESTATTHLAIDTSGAKNNGITLGMISTSGNLLLGTPAAGKVHYEGPIATANINHAPHAEVAQSTMKGRAAGAGTGPYADLSVAQIKAILALASSDLSDVTSGPWTPAITFATPGDLNVVYSTQIGTWRRIGPLMYVSWNIATSTFTFTTASGTFTISGLPVAQLAGTPATVGPYAGSGITDAARPHLETQIAAGGSAIQLRAGGSGATLLTVDTTLFASGTQVISRGSILYPI